MTADKTSAPQGNLLACDWCQETLDLNQQIIRSAYRFHLECLDEVQSNAKLETIFFGNVEAASHIKQTEPHTSFVSFWRDEDTHEIVGMDGGVDHTWIVLVPNAWEIVLSR